jgi:colicin import membrane protein
MNELQLSEGLKKEVATLEEMTKTVAVRNTDERTVVYQMVQSVKSKRSAIVEFFADSKTKAHAAWKAIVGMEKNETDKLDAFEAAGKRAILAYDQAEAAKAEAERRRLQAIADESARKEREKAEAEARRQRQIEQEARDKAEAARRAAEAADAAERARLLKEAEAAERKAAAAAVKAENQTENAAAVQAAVAHVAPVAVKQAGESTRGIWRAVVKDAAAVPREWLIVDTKALDAFAKATKGAKAIPGVEFIEEKTLAIRS